jgi:hypothetical protein
MNPFVCFCAVVDIQCFGYPLSIETFVAHVASLSEAAVINTAVSYHLCKLCFRLARCLYELQWVQEASDCMQAFKSKFPDHVHSHACKALVKDIETASASKPDFGKSVVL